MQINMEAGKDDKALPTRYVKILYFYQKKREEKEMEVMQ